MMVVAVARVVVKGLLTSHIPQRIALYISYPIDPCLQIALLLWIVLGAGSDVKRPQLEHVGIRLARIMVGSELVQQFVHLRSFQTVEYFEFVDQCYLTRGLRSIVWNGERKWKREKDFGWVLD